MQEIYFETKPQGAGRNWLEVGHFEVDDFGDRVWKPSDGRYPNKDPRLKVQRKYEGKGARQAIRWLLHVPADYPLTILCRSGDSRHEGVVVWEPAQVQAE